MHVKGKNKKIIWIGGGIIIAAAVIAVSVYFLFIRKGSDTNFNMRPDMSDVGENVITASGLTVMGMTDEESELDFLETALYIEENYIAVGETIEAGTPVFKVSEESLTDAKAELDKAVTETNLLYRQGRIDYETGKLEAKQTCTETELSSLYVQAEYDDSLSQSKNKIKKLQEQVEEAKELYDEYCLAAVGDYYAEYYEIEELQNTYYDNFSYLMELYEKWDIEELSSSQTVQSGNAMSSEADAEAGGEKNAEAGKSADGGMNGAQRQSGNQDSEKVSVYEMMVELVDKNGEEYEEAKTNYEKDKLMAQASLEQAQSNLNTLQAELSEAELAYEKQKISSKANYDTTVANSDNAQTVYDTEIKKLEEEFEALKDDKEEAEENLTVFENAVGDGYFYTKGAGTVVMNKVKEKSYLSSGDIILAYSNPELVSVSASVGQSDIAQINIGDNAYAVINEYGSYEGYVVSVNPVSESGSHSTVIYSVTIELEGETEGIEANLTAAVYFGLKEEQKEQMEKMVGKEPESIENLKGKMEK